MLVLDTSVMTSVGVGRGVAMRMCAGENVSENADVERMSVLADEMFWGMKATRCGVERAGTVEVIEVEARVRESYNGGIAHAVRSFVD